MNDRHSIQTHQAMPSFIVDNMCELPSTPLQPDNCGAMPAGNTRRQSDLLSQQPLLRQQLREQEHRQFQSTLNAAYLSISPMLAFSSESLFDLANSGGVGGGGNNTGNGNEIGGNGGICFYSGSSPTDDAVVGSPPPNLSSELMLAESGFYVDQYAYNFKINSPDQTCWNQGFEELDLERSQDGMMCGGGGSKAVVQRNHNPCGGDPTLAALNAGSEERSLLDDLDLDDLPLPDEIDYRGIRMSGLNTPTNNDSQDGLALLGLASLVAASPATTTTGTATVNKLEPNPPAAAAAASVSLHELLVRSSRADVVATPPTEHQQQQPDSDPPLNDCWSATTDSVKTESEIMLPTDVAPSQAVAIDDQFDMQFVGCRSRAMRPRTATMSSGESMLDGSVVSSLVSSEVSTDVKDESHDEGFDSEPDDSDRYSDADSTSSWDQSHRSRSPNASSATRPRRKERFFWQYNLQAKGPKGNRMPIATDVTDPHQLDEVTDPVFSPNCQVKGIKHTGKARRGDGNDLTPNPCKLHQIGEELKKLNKVIDELTPVGELPFNVRPKSRKEKNKLASRACRLKKKAQHEANKIKLYGLEQEHRRLMFTLNATKTKLRQTLLTAKSEAIVKHEPLETQLETFASQAIKSTRVAGNTIDFVNKVLAKVSTGNRSAPELEQE